MKGRKKSINDILDVTNGVFAHKGGGAGPMWLFVCFLAVLGFFIARAAESVVSGRQGVESTDQDVIMSV